MASQEAGGDGRSANRDQTASDTQINVGRDADIGHVGTRIYTGGGDYVAGDKFVNISPPRPVTPQQRPPRAEHFTGREAELAWLMGALRPGELVSLCGPGGMGKTALAAEAVFRLAENGELANRFPDGVVVHSFDGQPETALALAHLVQSFLEGAREFTLEAARRALAGKRALLVLDGAEEAADLEMVLGIRGACGVLITSRRRSDGRGALRDARPLPLSEGVALFKQWQFGEATGETIEALVSQLGGLPLAIQLVGRYLQAQGETVNDYLAWLAETPFQALSPGERTEENVALLLARSVAQVAEAAQLLLRAIGVLAPAPFPPSILVTGLGLEEKPARRALGELVNYGLLRRERRRFVISHALAYYYARRRMPPTADVVRALMEAVRAEADAVDVDRIPADSLPLLPHLQALAEPEVALNATLTAALCNQIGYRLNALADYAGARYYFERALAIREDVLGPDHLDIATSLNNLGYLLQTMGDFVGARSYLERALAIREQRLGPDHPDTATSLHNLAGLLRALGDYAQARFYYERALAITEQVLGSDHPDTAGSLNNLGHLLQATGDLAGARPYYERALAIWEQALGPDHPDTAGSLNNLGYLLQATGNLAEARPYYERALAIRERALGPDHPDTATSLNNMGALLRALGDYSRARPYYERALAIREKALGPHHPDTATSLNNLGYLLQTTGDLAAARLCHERALAIREQALGPDHPDTATSFNNLGVLSYHEGDLAAAAEYIGRALAIYEGRFGADHPELQKMRRNLAFIQEAAADRAE